MKIAKLFDLNDELGELIYDIYERCGYRKLISKSNSKAFKFLGKTNSSDILCFKAQTKKTIDEIAKETVAFKILTLNKEEIEEFRKYCVKIIKSYNKNFRDYGGYACFKYIMRTDFNRFGGVTHDEFEADFDEHDCLVPTHFNEDVYAKVRNKLEDIFKNKEEI